MRGPLPDSANGDQTVEAAMAQAMLRRVSRGEAGSMLRVYRPTGSVVAFGRRDVRLDGFPRAVEAVRRAGFTPCVRASGGRAVAYTDAALVVDHVGPDPEWPSNLEARFRQFGELWAGVLRGFGVDARVGEVPGEYCPGAHSVNARGVVKLVGTAQRMVRGAWLFSAVVVLDGAEVLRPLLRELYDALHLPFADSTVGSLVEEVDGVTWEALERAVLRAYDGAFGVEEVGVPEAMVAEARELAGEHRL